MRGFRWLLLAAIAVILAAVGGTYYSRVTRQAAEAPPPPPELPPNIAATSDTWVHTEYDGERPVVEIRAEKMRQLREPATFELEGVELRIFQPGGYDRVRCGRAEFDVEKSLLYSEGPVEMTLDVPEGGAADESSLVRIESSRVRFDTKSGRVRTEAPARFRFPRGEGRSKGASYDPRWKDLRMHQDVKLRWYGDLRREEILVEAGSLVYKEDQDKVYLSPWSRFRKGALELHAADSVVGLREGALDRIDAWEAAGRHGEAGRQTEFAAAHLVMIWAPDMTIRKIVGESGARLVSRTEGSTMTAAGERLFLDFRPAEGDSVLEHALLMGDGRVELRPAAEEAEAPPEDRILTSEVIHAYLRDDGTGFERIETGAPGVVEFRPRDPGGERRRIEGERIWMRFAPGNRLELFRASRAATLTIPPETSGRPPRRTWSDDFIARFDAAGELLRIDQTGNFRLEQGEQRARAGKGVYEPPREIFLLVGSARIADARGSTAADRILWDQRKDAVTAEGNVASTRLPEEKAGEPDLLAAGEPVHARARKMTARNGGAVVVYEGEAVLWQGADRIEAARIVIDREKKTLAASGSVVTRLRMQQEGSTAQGPARFTVVRAERFFYSSERRLGTYRGSVRLEQPGLEVFSKELRAFFAAPESGEEKENGGGRRLERLVATGGVRVILKDGGRVRTGLGERAEYYLAEEKLVLRGGRPKLIDTERGTAQGDELTYYARNDRLLVDGDEVRPAVSRLRTRRPPAGPGGGE